VGAWEWQVERVRGSGARLHAASAALVGSGTASPVAPRAPASSIENEAGALPPLARTIRVLEVDAPALILGSTQPSDDVDAAAAAAARIEVARRRSGGGAVLVGPDEVVWIDVALPAGDPLWHDDIGRAAWWIGECWAQAVAEVTGVQPHVWKGALVRTSWSPMVCFAGLGPGEVEVDGAKVVGVSQRRTRRGVLFQTAALLRWRPAPLLDLFAIDARRRAAGVEELAPVAAGLGADVASELTAAMVDQVRRAG
jgi:lipoate---protein ligase